jgi:Glycosyltransferase family 87
LNLRRHLGDAAARRATLGLVALALIALGASLYGNRDRFDRADFRLYYAWWSEWREGINPWQPSQAALRLDAPGHPVVGYCDYTPFWVIALSPFGWPAEHTAYWIWIAFQLAALVAAVLLLAGEARPPPEGVTGLTAVVALALLYPPVHVILHGAQPATMLLLVVAAAWWLDRRGKPAAAGLMLASVALLKAYPAAIGGYFLFRRRLRTIAWAAALGAAGILLTGLGRWREFLLMSSASAIRMSYQPRMVGVWPNVSLALRQLFGVVDPRAAANLALTGVIDAAIIFGASIATARAGDDSNSQGLCLSLWIVVALLLSPMSWDHEMTLMIPVYIFAAARVIEAPARPRGAALIASCLALSMVPFLFKRLMNLHLLFISVLGTFAGLCVLAVASEMPRARATRPSQ